MFIVLSSSILLTSGQVRLRAAEAFKRKLMDLLQCGNGASILIYISLLRSRISTPRANEVP